MRRLKSRLAVCLVCTLALFVLFSCGSGPLPSEVAKTFYTALYGTGNVQIAREYASIKILGLAVKNYGSVEKWVMTLHTEKLDEGFNLARVEVLEEDIEDGRAELRLKLHGAEGNTDEEDAFLVKEDGKWKVTID